MIKMTIGGEEVVSNKEFTINEEMLSASSTILNNCYPKSWEDNKDYTSNFYYPKDYSKFLLGEGEFLHGLDEYAILKTSGKNLFNSQAKDINKGLTWNNGILFDDNKSITTDFLEKNYLKELYSNYFFVAFYYDENKNYLGNGEALIKNVTNATKHTIIPNNASITYIRITYRSSWNNNIDMTTLTDVMLTVNASDLTPYMPFGENISYETNVEKEWNSFNVYGKTYQDTRSGKNLFNKEAQTNNKGLTWNFGVYFDETGSVVSDYFEKGNLTELYSNYYFVAFYYDIDKNYLGNGPNLVKVGTASNTSTVIPNESSIAYVRVEYRTSFNNNIDMTTKTDIMLTKMQSELTPYEEYGAMPSPDYPSELVSVGYENLLGINNKSSTTISGLTYSITSNEITINGTATANGRFILEELIKDIEFESSKNYKIQLVSSGEVSKTFTIQLRNDSSNIYSIEYQYLVLEPKNITNINGNVNHLGFYIASGTIFTDFKIKLQVEKGVQAHTYIPYGKYGIEIKNTGKNLLEPNFETSSAGGITITYTKNGWLVNGTPTSTVNAYIFNSTLPAGTYTINGIEGSANNKYQLVVYKAGIIIRYLTTGSYTFILTEETAIALRLYLYQNYGTFNNLLLPYQLEKGSQATTYEEYKSNSQLYVLDEPLRAIGQYQDRLYVDNSVLFVERKIGSVILNGSENWQYLASNYNWFYTTFSNFNANDYRIRINALCNYYKAVLYTDNLNNGECTTYIGGGNKFAIKNTNYTNVNDFKNWLSINKPEVQYVLINSIIEPIGYVDLPNSYENINYVNLYTGLDTSMEVYYYWKNFNVLFAGVVKNTGDISLNPRYPHYCNLQILDYKTFLSESNTLDFVIANKTVKEAIGMVVNAISGYGFILGEINIDSADDIIGAYSTLNKTAYDVLQYLANISGSRWRARYVDSSTMAIDFYDPDTLPQGANIEYTQEYWENNNIVDLTFNYGTRDYRNKQILLSDEVYANINYNETLISNGYTNTFTLQNNIGTVVNILVGNEEKTVATTNDKQMGIDADFYYAPGKNILESNSVYSAGTLIKITYQPLVKGRQIVYNTNEVDRISTQTDTEGIIARYENRNDILSSDELEKIAQTYIEYKGKAEVILTLTTRNNDLYNIGEVVYFDAPIPDLAQNYMVKTKKTEYIVIDEIVNLFYIYEMTSSFNSEKAINYFDNQRNKASGNIAEGDSITRNIDIETDVAIIWTGGTVSSASITVDGDNVLNSVLNSPFVE